eukprot:1155848-Pelagomonas_calceolata.AAC.6
MFDGAERLLCTGQLAFVWVHACCSLRQHAGPGSTDENSREEILKILNVCCSLRQHAQSPEEENI